jgi:signal peptidase I
MRETIVSILEFLQSIIIALVAIFIIRNFLVQPFLVSGASMEPTFSSGDYLLIDEITYRFREPKRGEVIVFHYPNNEKVYYIKRIIGLPGERVVFENGKVKIFNQEYPNGFFLEEHYLDQDSKTVGQEFLLGANEYFVLGDNRYYSSDSRVWGSLKKSEIVGLVRFRLLPVSKVMAIEAPVY